MSHVNNAYKMYDFNVSLICHTILMRMIREQSSKFPGAWGHFPLLEYLEWVGKCDYLHINYLKTSKF